MELYDAEEEELEIEYYAEICQAVLLRNSGSLSESIDLCVGNKLWVDKSDRIIE